VRRSVVGIPLLAAAAALLGILLSARPVVAVAVALAAGLVVAAGLAARAERRLEQVTDRVLRLAEGDLQGPARLGGSTQARRLEGALGAVGATLRGRFDALARERERSERLLDGLPLAVVLFAGQGVAYANPAARHLFPGGVPPQELADAVAEAMETGRPIQVELVVDGRDLKARASATGPGEIAVVVSDLTETRRVEAMRRTFVTNASHELKTPVAGMQALADSLAVAVERDPERARRMIERLREEAVRLARLVRELLDLARLEEATAQRARRVDLTGLVEGQVERLKALAELRGVTFAVDVEEDASVVANPEDVRLIVGNLLENAVRYNHPDGEVRVQVRRRGGDVCVAVTDTGIGIPKADRDRIFERFYRVDKARSRAAGGTGLGLSLVRHAVERLGGHIALSSTVGEGSTFTVTLPTDAALG
jgi:signal transduction histidine kinase